MRKIAVTFSGLFLVASSIPAWAGYLIGTKMLVEMVKGAGTVDTGQTSFVILPGGNVATTIGCNRIAGNAVIDGTNLKFGPLMSTRKACAAKLMEQEQIYTTALDSVRSYSVDGGLTKLLDEHGEVLISLAPTPAQ